MTSVARRYAIRAAAGTHPTAATDDARAPVVLMVSGGADSTALLVLAATSALDVGDGRGTGTIARERLHVLHVNHQLRGIDAEEDEEFVRDLAARFGIPCTVRRVDVAACAVAAREHGGADAANIEAVGRDARYAAARALADELSARFGTPRAAARILTAHTADDRAETFLMNATRGTGAAGLASIPRRRGRVVRPLLDRTHAELCELLRMRGIVWREDITNHDTRHLRAFVRHDVLPTLAARNPQVVASLATTCDILGDEDAYLTRVAARAYRSLVRHAGNGMVALDAGRLAAADVAVARRVVRQALLDVCPGARLEARHVTAVLHCVAAGSGAVTVPVDVDARVEHGLLLVRGAAGGGEGDGGAGGAGGETVAWLEVPGRSTAGGGGVRGAGGTGANAAAASARGAGASFNAATAGAVSAGFNAATDDIGSGVGRVVLRSGRVLTARLVSVPRGSRAPDLARAHAAEWEGTSVLLDAAACGIDATSGGRLWVDVPAPGDVLRPLGMHGQSKKVSDLMGEAGVPLAERGRLPLVRRSPTGPVLWVAGIRPSEDVRCTPASRLLLELTLLG